jgi:hypothetical protein
MLQSAWCNAVTSLCIEELAQETCFSVKSPSYSDAYGRSTFSDESARRRTGCDVSVLEVSESDVGLEVSESDVG